MKSLILQRLVNSPIAYACVGVSFILIGFYLPWWGLIVPAFIGGLVMNKNPYSSWAIAGIGGLSWILAAATQDALTGFRLSARLSAMLGLKYGFFLYLALALLAGVAAWLAAQIGATFGKLFSQGHRTAQP